MALTHRIVKRVELEHEPGQWIQVRMPSLAILDRARQARSRQAIELVAGIDLSQLRPSASQASAASEPDYDWQVLLSGCILAWSYEDSVTPENVAELDAVTVRVLMAELVPTENEAERKNGSGGSTTPLTVVAPRPTSG